MGSFGATILITLLLLIISASNVEPFTLNEQNRFFRSGYVSNPGLFETNHTELFDQPLSISRSCNDDFQQYLFYVVGIILSFPVEAPSWVYQLLDATGKPGSGILEGNVHWLGSFTECLKVEATKYNSTETQFRGQYCTSSMAINSVTFNDQLPVTKQVQQMLRPILNGFQINPTGITLGLCMPSSCTAPELTQLVKGALPMLGIDEVTINIEQEMCYTKEATKYGAGSIMLIIVLVTFGVLLIMSTICEIVIIRRRSKDFENQNNNNSTIKKVLLSFSIYKNGRKILDTSHSEGTLTCLHGIRFLSMAWVVLGHTYANLAFLPLNNWLDFPNIARCLAFDIIMNAFFAVDTFFFLSGFLVAYLLLKELKKTGGQLGPYRIFLFYFHRYWRLTPALAIGVAFLAGLYSYLANGPSWRFANSAFADTCHDNWWRNLLYIQNLFNSQHMCFGVTWYLAVDMQLYAVSLLIIYPIYRFQAIGFTILGAVFVASMLIPGLIIHFLDLPSLSTFQSFEQHSDKQKDFVKYVYIKPWCRMGPYIVGIMLATLLHRTTLQPKLQPLVVAVGWLLTTVLALTIVFGTHDYFTGDKVMSNGLSSFYGACSKPAWAIVVAWVVFACVTGHGGFVNTILSWEALIPLSRLTYTAYLVHMYLILTFFGSQENVYHFNHYFMIIMFLGMLAISMTLAFVYSLAFEAPMIELEKIFLPRRSNDSYNCQRRLYIQPGISCIEVPNDQHAERDLSDRNARKDIAYENEAFKEDDSINKHAFYERDGKPISTL